MSTAEGICRYCDKPFVYEQRGTATLYCSPEHRTKARVRRQRETNEALQERWCPRCKKMQPATDFGGATSPYCKPHAAEWMRKNRKDRPAAYTRIERLRNYGMTVEQWEAIFEAQGRRCKICGCTEPGGPGVAGWHVDHDHACCPARKRSCGKCWRGILCSNCNHVLGNARDDPVILQAALDYLRAYRARREAEGHINPMQEEGRGRPLASMPDRRATAYN